MTSYHDPVVEGRNSFRLINNCQYIPMLCYRASYIKIFILVSEKCEVEEKSERWKREHAILLACTEDQSAASLWTLHSCTYVCMRILRFRVVSHFMYHFSKQVKGGHQKLMSRKFHNHRPQTNPRHREEQTHNIG